MPCLLSSLFIFRCLEIRVRLGKHSCNNTAGSVNLTAFYMNNCRHTIALYAETCSLEDASNIRHVVCFFIKLCRLYEFTSVNYILISIAQWDVSAKYGRRFPTGSVNTIMCYSSLPGAQHVP